MPLTEDDLMQYLNQRQGLDIDQLDRGTVLFSDGLLDSFRMVFRILSTDWTDATGTIR